MEKKFHKHQNKDMMGLYSCSLAIQRFNYFLIPLEEIFQITLLQDSYLFIFYTIHIPFLGIIQNNNVIRQLQMNSSREKEKAKFNLSTSFNVSKYKKIKYLQKIEKQNANNTIMNNETQYHYICSNHNCKSSIGFGPYPRVEGQLNYGYQKKDKQISCLKIMINQSILNHATISMSALLWNGLNLFCDKCSPSCEQQMFQYYKTRYKGGHLEKKEKELQKKVQEQKSIIADHQNKELNYKNKILQLNEKLNQLQLFKNQTLNFQNQKKKIDEELQKKLQQFQVSEQAIKILLQQGLTTTKDLSEITKEDLKELGLKLKDVLVIQRMFK